MLGEDDELALAAIGVAHLRGILQKAGEFFPFTVLAGVHHLPSLLFKPPPRIRISASNS